MSNSPFPLPESVVLAMGKGDRQKATGGSVAWTSLILSGLLEKGRTGRCTKPRTRIQVRMASDPDNSRQSSVTEMSRVATKAGSAVSWWVLAANSYFQLPPGNPWSR